MSRGLHPQNKAAWLWLYHHGGAWTVNHVARAIDADPQALFQGLYYMVRRDLVRILPPDGSSWRRRYAVTRGCFVPTGITLQDLLHAGGPNLLDDAPGTPAPRAHDYGLSPAELPYLRNPHSTQAHA